jgi:heavy metal sensor kinase
LRWRLIALYGAILVAVLVFFAMALSWRLRASLVEALDRELAMRTRAIAAELEVDGERWFIEDAAVANDYRDDTRRWFVVADMAGRVMLRSGVASSLDARPAAVAGTREVVAGGQRFRELVVDVPWAAENGGSGPDTLRIACASPLAAVDAATSSVIAEVWFVGPVVLLLAMAGGFLLVSRALRPIGDIAATARRITADDLSGRIAVRGDDELARLSRTLNDTFARLQTAVERERRFTADASHELRTPLAVIAGNVELAQGKDRPADELRELFAEVAAAASRMRATVDGLLLLARADAGAFPLERQPVSLRAIVRETVRLLQPLAAQRNVTVACDADEVVVNGDAERLRQLATNLLDNAIRYNRPGGSATVRVRGGGPGRAELVVEDTGIGIRTEHLGRVFERFFRADPARSREPGVGSAGGTGLGLAIAKSIAAAHGGSIAVTSEADQGTRFVVTLPA